MGRTIGGTDISDAGAPGAGCRAVPPPAHAQTQTALGRAALPTSAPVKPRMVLNAAAYTAVDRSETQPEAAYVANVVGAELVALAAAAQHLPVIHISTDYVFDGTKIGAYVETEPINVAAQWSLNCYFCDLQ